MWLELWLAKITLILILLFLEGGGTMPHICFDFDIPGTFEASFFYLKHIYYLLFTLYYLLFIHLAFLHLVYSNNQTPFLATFTLELDYIYCRAVASLEKVCLCVGRMTFYTIIIVKLTFFIDQLAKIKERAALSIEQLFFTAT